MSCYGNDYGWDHAYAKFLEHFADPETLVILISSSGNSQNILNAAEYCLGKNNMVTLSGFNQDNKLKTIYGPQSLLHFYIPSTDYGIVEILHELVLHSVI
jgi:D-sedoheptulose 7-phosphate isomerase